jgi:hypothetical protein
MVNDTEKLTFFHFSGISVDGGNRISKHTDQFDLASRPDLVELFALYRERLIANGIRDVAKHAYGFGSYSNGALVNKLQRAAFAANLDRFGKTNPFDVAGPFYEWATKRHLRAAQDSIGSYSRKAYNKADRRVRIVNNMMRWVLRLIGADRYTVLMKYLEYASLLRNQRDVYDDAANR